MRASAVISLLGALVLLGCAPEHTSACGCGPPRTHRYVVSRLRIPEASGTMAYGFDLDGVTSTGEGRTCVDLTPDFTSINDPGETGIDNGLAPLVPTLSMLVGDLDATLDAQIASGSQLLVLEVADITSYTSDTSITLRLYAGTVQEGETLALEPDGTLSPGQEFDLEPLGPAGEGSIVNGRLRATLESFTVTIDAGGDIGAISLKLHDVQVRANVSQLALSDGAIGGAIVIDELVPTGGISDGTEEIVRSAIQGDLRPDPLDETTCLALSAGLSFHAIDHVDDFDDPTD